MKLSYNWLKEFVDIKVNPQKLAEDLGLFGHSVESINKKGDDCVLDLEITANRGDCLSVLGMARETAALYNSKFKTQNSKLQLKTQNLDKKIMVKISDARICLRFTARIIDNIKIGESPKWMQDRLRTVGIRPLNNIVDVTNYAMIETGQPLHAFDYDKIHDGVINIRLAKSSEMVVTLDEVKRTLDSNSIIIEDYKKIYDLAGIMGGFNSEVNKDTKTIILQGAIFDPVLIRRTSKRLKLQTEASYRYERGVDIEGTIYGVNRASQLIKKLCPAARIAELIDIQPKKIKPTIIKFTPDQINRLLGTKISGEKMTNYLNHLGFKTLKPYNPTTLHLSVEVPSYRLHDIKIWQDLAEEIARIHGYNKINRSLPKKIRIKENKEYNQKEVLKDILVQQDFTEVYSYSFADKRLLERLGYDLKDCRRVINGISPETEYLRPSLFPSLFTAVAKNPWAPEVKIFEIGKVFIQLPSEVEGMDSCEVGEGWQLGIATTEKSEQTISRILEMLEVSPLTSIKNVDQKILDFLKIRRPVKYVIFDLDKLSIKAATYKKSISEIKYKPISQFAPTVRDLAFLVDKKINAEEIKTQISCLHPQILLVELFDEFVSDKFGKNKKNVAYHIWLQDLWRPMPEEATKEIIKKIISNIEKMFSADLRK